jgi:hypothetical protein
MWELNLHQEPCLHPGPIQPHLFQYQHSRLLAGNMRCRHLTLEICQPQCVSTRKQLLTEYMFEKHSIGVENCLLKGGVSLPKRMTQEVLTGVIIKEHSQLLSAQKSPKSDLHKGAILPLLTQLGPLARTVKALPVCDPIWSKNMLR